MRSKFGFGVLLLLLASVASATTIVLPTDDQLILKSPVIAVGTVVQSAPVDIEGRIFTETRLAVERVVKGQVDGDILTIREVGGEIGDRLSVVFGSADYKAGERVLVFLWPTGRGDYQTRDLFVGKFSEEYTMEGTRVWFRKDTRANTQLLDAEFNPIPPSRVQRDADRFERFVADRVAGRTGDANYGIDAPQMRFSRIEADFELISEPSIYRWFAFDNGGSASWLTVSQQPGYSDGGVAETKSALQTWNGVAGAQIRYVYGGASTASPGGLSRVNGINEVIFNDVTGEIDGSWSGSTGGVVGRGGFNRVTSGGSWTSPFSADADHPQKTYSSTGNITEGNLVIQNGVSPSAGISSTTLNAILAHELGHTLGFGHSEDSGALMYYTVRAGGGAYLNADDQMAAKWLYPGSTGTTPPPPPPPTAPAAPAAPSNLTASVITGSTPQVRLTWKINATNATSQQVYGAEGSGSFAPVGAALSATATSATLTNILAGRTYRFYVTARNSAGESAASNVAQVTLPNTTTSTTLSLNSSRFRVTLAARDQRTGKTGSGQAIPQNDLFGYFSIPALTSDTSNPEVFVKVLDGSGVNGYFWVFYGGLTDLEYNITVTDSRTGRFKVYNKTAGSACGGFDTAAFSGNGSAIVEPLDLEPEEILADSMEFDSLGAIRVTEDLTSDACSSSTSSLCLNSSRFKVTLAARDQRTGRTGAGQAIPQNPLFGYFSIPALTSNESNPEVFVKVLDGRPVNGRFWVFYGGLTDLEYMLTVTDTVTGAVKRYTKAGGSACGGFDTGAF
ncbi:MAG: matrixin family metalloprotease [Thermoanaerobaculia bacterium]